jgi:hypothetical protein
MIYPEQQITESFKKRDVIIHTADNPEYPQYIKFELLQDKVNMIDGFQNGQIVNVHYNLRGREKTMNDGEVRYFNSLIPWKIELADNSAADTVSQPAAPASQAPASQGQQQQAAPKQQQPQQQGGHPFEGEDDLPF